MRQTLVFVLLGGCVWGQAMVEHAVAAAGGSAAGVAGKKVSDGITKILTKVDQQTRKAADTTRNARGLEVGPGTPKAPADSVPPPPPARRAAVQKLSALPPPPPIPARSRSTEAAPVPPPPPPEPEATGDDLKNITAGMHRDDVLKLGAPASRITMFEDGHVVEIYRYMAKDTTLGVVRLTDGAVSSIQKP